VILPISGFFSQQKNLLLKIIIIIGKNTLSLPEVPVFEPLIVADLSTCHPLTGLDFVVLFKLYNMFGFFNSFCASASEIKRT